jgi:uncharacterized tellurite resistance protein B-like protein
MDPRSSIRLLIDTLCDRFEGSDEGLNAAVDLAVLVAAADGRIDDAELAALAASLEAIIGSRLDPKVVRHLIQESRKQIREAGAEARASAIGKTLAAHGAAEEGIRLALEIALASEGISQVERQHVETVAEAAGVEASKLDEMVRAMRPASN